jgi:Xaa-Pro aminopeptidase
MAGKSKKSRKKYECAGGATPDEIADRLGALRERFAKAKIDALLVTSAVNVRYLSGFIGDDSYLLVTPRTVQLLTDFRYIEDAQHSAPHAKVVVRRKRGLMEEAARGARAARVKVLGVENSSSVLQVGILKAKREGLRIKPVGGLVEALREIKTPTEVHQIETAIRVQQSALRTTIRSLRTGQSELAVAARLRYEMTRTGKAQDQAFSIIAAFDARASLPHARPSDAKLRKNSLVLIDWGAVVNFYHADLTRTFFMGTISRNLKRVWEIVRDAQEAALEKIGPGVKLADVDRSARRVIEKAGYGKAFGHSLGHGIGMQIHEAPGLSSRAQGVCKPGMVVTIEPGIYLPGVGGVRIEDDVLITETGSRVLSSYPKALSYA